MPSPERSSSTEQQQSQNSSRMSHSRSTSPRDDVSQHSRHRGSRAPSPRRPRPSHRRIPRKRTAQEHRKYVGAFDFEEKYDEDPVYEELEPTARVWRAFMDECEVFDNDMVTEARDGLDLLLVFAGLFSAVLTTFVAQTSQALSNNFAAVSTSLLLEIATLQRAQINGTSTNDIPISDMTSGPSGFDIWVNALWFTSLALSLGTALMAVLVKQWLYQYMSMTSGTPRDHSLIRQYRFNGLRKWHVLTIISILPIILHIALGVFLIGLVVFLIPLNTPLACVVSFITALVYAVYIITNIMPILDTQCPFRTPFSDVLNVGIRQVRALVSSAQELAIRASRVLYDSPPNTAPSRYTVSVPTNVCVTLKEAERIVATDLDRLWENTFNALSWLFQSTSNIPTKHIIMQSIGPFPDDWSGQLGPLFKEELEQLIRVNLHDGKIIPGHEYRIERLMRSYKHVDSNQSRLPFSLWILDDVLFEPPFHLLASILMHCSPSHYISVQADSMLGPRWNPHDLLAHIVQHVELIASVRLPSYIWRHLIDTSYQHGSPYIDGLEVNTKIFQIALMNLRARPKDSRNNITVSVPLGSGSGKIFLTRPDVSGMPIPETQNILGFPTRNRCQTNYICTTDK